MKFNFRAEIWMILAFFAAGCAASPTAQATQPPTLAGEPAATQEQPAQASPSSPASPAASPAATTQVPTPTPLLPPTATPQGRIGPDALPADVNPLTGETVPDPAVLDHRPLAVKIVNQPPCARPQFGLNQAALVFEHYVEAWGTRFTAIYYGQEAENVGAVRSARLIDLELPAIFDAVLVTSGSSGGVKQRLLASDFAGRIISAELEAGCPPLCRVPKETVACGDTEHTMFTTTAHLHAEAAARGIEARPALSGWAFSALPLAAGQPADVVHVNYLNAPVDWFYDPEAARYLRSQSGSRQVDALNQLRLNAANVVVLFANHLYSDIRESTNFYSLEIQFWGQGPALVFRDGQAYEATWLRHQRQGLFQLVDAAGAPVPLKPGRTWFEFAALDSETARQDGEWTISPTVLPQQTPPQP